jgi:hypothetical protein
MSNHKQINKCSPLVNNKYNNSIRKVNLYKPVNEIMRMIYFGLKTEILLIKF